MYFCKNDPTIILRYNNNENEYDKKPRSIKHQHDRLIDKRRRRIGKEICQKG